MQEESAASSQSTTDEEAKAVPASEADKKDNPYSFENLSMEKGQQVHLKDFSPLILQTRKDVRHPTMTLLGFG